MSDAIDDTQDSRYHMKPPDIFQPGSWFTWPELLYMLGNASPSVVTCDFKPQEHVPGTSTRAHTCAVVFRRLPACPAAESTRNDPLVEERKMLMCENNTLFCSHIRSFAPQAASVAGKGRI